LCGESRRDARGSAARDPGRRPTVRRATPRSALARRLGARTVARAPGRRRHPGVSRHRPDCGGRRAHSERSGEPGGRVAHQAVQPEQAHGADRRAAGGRAPPAPPVSSLGPPGPPMSVWAAILAGGSGTRFWPLSTPERPKQLLPLAGDRALLLQTVERLEGLVPPERILILTGPFLVDQVARAVPQIPRAQILAEPRAASTAPALTWAAHWISQRDPGAQMLFQADAGLPVEGRLAGTVGRVEVLKVGHHGSKTATSDAWLDELAPHEAVISVGRNNHYGHPAPEVLERLARHGVTVLRTDRSGTITLSTDG